MKAKKEIKMVKLKDTSAMSEVEKDAYVQKVWSLLTEDKKNPKEQSIKTSTDNKPYQPYQVTFKGSSILGESNGPDNFKLAHLKISELRDKGRAKCYKRWCKACTLYRLQLDDDVTGHVIKISFPNVITLANIIKINWSWERPDSEWAKKIVDPEKAYKSLVERKSKPVFYARLESEEYINMLLGGEG
jgi:hypothetical protein